MNIFYNMISIRKMEFSKGWALRFSFFGKKGVRLGLVVKGEGRVPGTCLVDFCLLAGSLKVFLEGSGVLNR